MALDSLSYGDNSFHQPIPRMPFDDVGEDFSISTSVSTTFFGRPVTSYKKVNFSNAQEVVLHIPKNEGLESVFAKIVKYWGLSIDQAAALLGYPAHQTFKAAGILAGLAKFDGNDQIERTILLFELNKLLGGLFQNRDAERLWLTKAQDELEGKSPLSLLEQRSFRSLLQLKEFVEYLAEQ